MSGFTKIFLEEKMILTPIQEKKNLLLLFTCAYLKSCYCNSALCGNGAMILLKNEEFIPKICNLTGKSHPSVTRIEALKLFQVLLVRFISTEI